MVFFGSNLVRVPLWALTKLLYCEKCDGRMELVAFVTDPNLAAGVREQIGMSIPARAPPS